MQNLKLRESETNVSGSSACGFTLDLQAGPLKAVRFSSAVAPPSPHAVLSSAHARSHLILPSLLLSVLASETPIFRKFKSLTCCHRVGDGMV